MKNAFLAVPIQGKRLPNQVYKKIFHILGQFGFKVSNPAVLSPPMPGDIYLYSARDIYSENRQLIKASDLLVAEISTPSLGVGYEIAIAENFRIPIICIYQLNHEQFVSLMIRGIFYNKIWLVPYKTLDDLKTSISDVLLEISRSLFRKQASLSCSNKDNKIITSHFNELSKVYDFSADWRCEKKIFSWFKNVLSCSKCCLDLGTGTGLIGEQLVKNGTSVIGIDCSIKMLHYARSRLNYVICADVLELPFSDNEFDAVTIRQVLHYVYDRACLKEIARILSPNGMFAIAQIASPEGELASWWQEIKRMAQPLRRKFYVFQELIGLVKEVGFKVKQVNTMQITRNDPWDRFLINCNDESKPLVRRLLQKTPKPIANMINLQISDKGLSYLQNWILLFCRNAKKDKK